jgi:hypothetical protein
MTPTRRRMDPSTLEDILILKFNTDLWNAQLVQTILKQEKNRNSLCTFGSASTLTTATTSGSSSSGSSSSSSSSTVNNFEGMDEDNVDEKDEGSNFDD